MGDEDRRVEVIAERFVAFVHPARHIKGLLALGVSLGLQPIELFEGPHEFFMAFFCGDQCVVAKVQHRTVVGLHHKEAHHRRRESLGEVRAVSGEQFVRENGVTRAFAHSLAVQGKHIGVHPIGGAFGAVAGTVLGNFTFVVWKFEVHAAPVNVKRFPKVFGAHRRTLQVPTGKAHTPRGGPAHNVRW